MVFDVRFQRHGGDLDAFYPEIPLGLLVLPRVRAPARSLAEDRGMRDHQDMYH